MEIVLILLVLLSVAAFWRLFFLRLKGDKASDPIVPPPRIDLHPEPMMFFRLDLWQPGIDGDDESGWRDGVSAREEKEP